MVAELIPKVPSIPVIAVRSGMMQKAFEGLSDFQKTWAQEQNFSAKYGEVLALPDDSGALDVVLFGLGNERERKRGRLVYGKLPAVLPPGNYHLTTEDDDEEMAALAWLLSSYRFDRYKSNPRNFAKLVRPAHADFEKLDTIAQSAHIAMDLINRPANDLTPTKLEDEVKALALELGADFDSYVGNALTMKNFPMIYAVGQASIHQPRLVELNWGNEAAPLVTLVGKGVCFDTGGLDIKPSSSMGLMKKDMGGAANVIALAKMIMSLRLRVRLKVLLPIVENSVSSSAFRPGDILTSRNGLTVEVNNTDAEGRLILADSLSYATEADPDLIVSMATLTGAARVAVGPDLVPFFTDDDAMAEELMRSAKAVEDPLWRLPFWDPYEDMIEPDHADLDNAPAGGMAGAITAALFLRRFTAGKRYLHMDLYGWTQSDRPGRPKGGAVQGTRALFAYLEERYGEN